LRINLKAKSTAAPETAPAEETKKKDNTVNWRKDKEETKKKRSRKHSREEREFYVILGKKKEEPQA
jgi:hypothetical protein